MHAGAPAVHYAAHPPELLALRLCLPSVLLKRELPAILQGIQSRPLHKQQTGPECAFAIHGTAHASCNLSVALA